MGETVGSIVHWQVLIESEHAQNDYLPDFTCPTSEAGRICTLTRFHNVSKHLKPRIISIYLLGDPLSQMTFFAFLVNWGPCRAHEAV